MFRKYRCHPVYSCLCVYIPWSGWVHSTVHLWNTFVAGHFRKIKKGCSRPVSLSWCRRWILMMPDRFSNCSRLDIRHIRQILQLLKVRQSYYWKDSATVIRQFQQLLKVRHSPYHTDSAATKVETFTLLDRSSSCSRLDIHRLDKFLYMGALFKIKYGCFRHKKTGGEKNRWQEIFYWMPTWRSNKNVCSILILLFLINYILYLQKKYSAIFFSSTLK